MIIMVISPSEVTGLQVEGSKVVHLQPANFPACNVFTAPQPGQVLV
jgi:hypothetical protein